MTFEVDIHFVSFVCQFCCLQYIATCHLLQTQFPLRLGFGTGRQKYRILVAFQESDILYIFQFLAHLTWQKGVVWISMMTTWHFLIQLRMVLMLRLASLGFLLAPRSETMIYEKNKMLLVSWRVCLRKGAWLLLVGWFYTTTLTQW